MARSFARRALPVVSAIFVGALFVQVFLAGLGVFDDPASFATHRDFGYAIELFVVVMLILALVGREPRRIVGLTILLLIQFILQSVLVGLRADQPAIAALHPVNGFLIVLVAILVTRLSWDVRHEPVAPTSTASPISTVDPEATPDARNG
jgi:hypothetical protein